MKLNLKDYLKKIQYCAAVVDQYTKIFYRNKIVDTPYGNRTDTITFDSDFMNINTPVGTFHLYSSSGFTPAQFESFKKTCERITEVLGLIRKEKTIKCGPQGKYTYPEYSYVLPEVELEGTYTPEEVDEIWCSLPPLEFEPLDEQTLKVKRWESYRRERDIYRPDKVERWERLEDYRRESDIYHPDTVDFIELVKPAKKSFWRGFEIPFIMAAMAVYLTL